ncbi:hypothetical protein JKP88DRAFT_274005 [Tribonema minus]|uniref:Uncharacterized protein n=1 Tax=Tribonema minus TaxID=303371 RepID=A0A835YPM1_9STRA|nr:hypothetical protein JKP88DRAFT_274005 [Tribonema minus]
MPLEVNSIVRVKGLEKCPQLNGREGFIFAALNENGRFGVMLFNQRVDDMSYTVHDARKDLRKLIRPHNLEELESSKALVVTPTAAGSVTLEPFEFDCKLGDMDMDAEMACIRRKLGWTEVTSCNQTSYSKNCSYPDIFYYHDGSKKQALPNPIARLQHRDPKSVRGPVVVVRAEPPRVRDSFGTATHTIISGLSQDTSLWTPRLGHKEVLDTLAFFTTTTFPEVDKIRAMKRMGVCGAAAASMPHFFF